MQYMQKYAIWPKHMQNSYAKYVIYTNKYNMQYIHTNLYM